MPTPSIHRGLLVSAGVCGFTGVLAGTFGAHALNGRIAENLLNDFEIGVRYQLVHAVTLLAVAIIAGLLRGEPGYRLVRAAGCATTIGIIIFSGSLYALALSGHKWLGMITPFGGGALLVGWALLAVAGFRLTRERGFSASRAD